MSKHTKGPWFRDECGGLKGDVRASNGKWVALCWGIGSVKNPYRDEYKAECDANARLIAAAPELLEALEVFVDFPDDTFDGDHDQAFTMTVRLNDMRKARAIIAKAKGEQ